MAVELIELMVVELALLSVSVGLVTNILQTSTRQLYLLFGYSSWWMSEGKCSCEGGELDTVGR